MNDKTTHQWVKVLSNVYFTGRKKRFIFLSVQLAQKLIAKFYHYKLHGQDKTPQSNHSSVARKTDIVILIPQVFTGI